MQCVHQKHLFISFLCENLLSEAEDLCSDKCCFSGWLFTTTEGLQDSLEVLLLILVILDVASSKRYNVGYHWVW